MDLMDVLDLWTWIFSTASLALSALLLPNKSSVRCWLQETVTSLRLKKFAAAKSEVQISDHLTV
jgi:hypothetical protein